MFCKKCGKEIKEGAKFCTYCGEKAVIPVQAPVKNQEKTVEKRQEPVGKTGFPIGIFIAAMVCICVTAIALLGYMVWQGRADRVGLDDEAWEIYEDFVRETTEGIVPYNEIPAGEQGGSEGEAADFDSLALQETESEASVLQPDDGQAVSEQPSGSRYVLPTSNSIYLSMEDLSGLTQEECRLARNELYARHGRRFDDEQLQAYFDSCDWYAGTIAPEDFDDSVLNEFEIANRDLIVKYETEMGYR